MLDKFSHLITENSTCIIGNLCFTNVRLLKLPILRVYACWEKCLPYLSNSVITFCFAWCSKFSTRNQFTLTTYLLIRKYILENVLLLDSIFFLFCWMFSNFPTSFIFLLIILLFRWNFLPTYPWSLHFSSSLLT